jgi:hypothetical protein
LLEQGFAEPDDVIVMRHAGSQRTVLEATVGKIRPRPSFRPHVAVGHTLFENRESPPAGRPAVGPRYTRDRPNHQRGILPGLDSG